MSGVNIPSSVNVAIEFVAGSWTDVTSYVDWNTGISYKRGRSSEFSAPQTSQLTFTLDNTAGYFTPHSQGSPYWPNVIPRKRVRVTLSAPGAGAPTTYDASTYDAASYDGPPATTIWLGYIKGWPVPMQGGIRPMVSIVANDILDLLAKNIVDDAMTSEVTLDGPAFYYPLNDGTGSKSAADRSGNSQGALLPTSFTAGGGYTFAGSSKAIGPDGLSYVTFTPASGVSGSELIGTANVPAPSGGYTLEAWVLNSTSQFHTLPPLNVWPLNPLTVEVLLGGTFSIRIGLYYTGGALWGAGIGNSYFSGPSTYINPLDGNWHHVVFEVAASGLSFNFYLDGVLVGSNTTVPGVPIPTTATTAVVKVGGNGSIGYAHSLFSGSVAGVAFYPNLLGASRIAAHAALTNGYFGDTTGQRIARYLTWAGLSSSQYQLDAGAELVGAAHQTAGKSVLTLCQDMAVTEGGGSAFYANAAGMARFVDRNFRTLGTTGPAPTGADNPPAVILDATLDLDASKFSPAYDDLTLINDSTVTRQGGLAQRFVQAQSVTTYGRVVDQATTFAETDAAAALLAQQRATSYAIPGYRIPQLAVDVLTAQTPGLAAALPVLDIGARVRVASLASQPRTQIDSFVEGVTVTLSTQVFDVMLDASPADTPARFAWDSPAWGRWQADAGSLTLATGLTQISTSVVVNGTSGSPIFSTYAFDYPMQVQIDEEVITFTTTPSTSGLQQTFTGVLRGQNGTVAASHSAGANVDVSMLATWTL